MGGSTSRIPDGILPWTQSCFVCGESNPHGLHTHSRLSGGRVVLDYTTRESDLGYRHIVHGGIAMTLLDEVMTWAAIVQARRVCVAAEFTARLKHPIRVGQALRAEAWVVRATARLLFTESVLKNAEGVEVLSATGKYMPMPEEQVHLTEKDFVLHPSVLPPEQLLS